MKKILFLLLVVCGLAACDKGGDDTPKNIIITGGGTNQTIYADETSVNNGEGIKFSTTGAWRTEIEEVTRAVSWITLNQTSGDKAGDYTLQITLGQNTTGKDRKATIKIICGDTIITITVEQKGKTEDGNIPEEPDVPMADRLITKIERIDDRTEGVRGDEIFDFYYDSKNRVNKIVVTETEINGVGSAEKTTTWISTCIITYADNTVSYNYSQTENGVPDKDQNGEGEITLDNNGRAISGKGSYIKEKSYNEEIKFTYSLEYNSNGYLSKSERIDSDRPSETSVEKLTWPNGNLTQVWWGVNNDKDMIDKAIYGTVLNKTNLDLNWFDGTGLPDTEGFAFACGDSQNIFSLLGYMGKRAKNLVEQLSDGYISETDFTIKNSYTVDADGYPTMIEQSYKEYFIGGSNQSFEWVKGMSYKITYNK